MGARKLHHLLRQVKLRETNSTSGASLQKFRGHTRQLVHRISLHYVSTRHALVELAEQLEVFGAQLSVHHIQDLVLVQAAW